MFCQNFNSSDIIDAEAVSNLNISNFLITPGSGKLIRYITRLEPVGDIEKITNLAFYGLIDCVAAGGSFT